MKYYNSDFEEVKVTVCYKNNKHYEELLNQKSNCLLVGKKLYVRYGVQFDRKAWDIMSQEDVNELTAEVKREKEQELINEARAEMCVGDEE